MRRKYRRALAASGVRTAGLALAAVVQLFAASAHAGDRTQPAKDCESCNLRQTVVRDAREVFTAPARWDHRDRKVALRDTLLVVGSIALLDDPVRKYAQRQRGATSDRIADAFEPFGAEYAAATLLGYGVIGRLAHKPGAMKTAFDGSTSIFLASGLLVPALKAVTGRSRPRTDFGPHDWHPMSGDESFPSGHTSAAFALATSIAENSDRRWVKGLAYGVATMVGYARIDRDAHWLSDTAAGAFIGVAVGKSVANLDRDRFRARVGRSPELGTWELAVAKHF